VNKKPRGKKLTAEEKRNLKGVTHSEFARLDGCSQPYVSKAVSLGILKCYDDRSIDPALAGTNWRRRNRSANTPDPAPTPGTPPIAPTNPDTPIDESGESTPNLTNDQIKSLSRTDAERYKLIYDILRKKIEFEETLKEVARVDSMISRMQKNYAKVRSRLTQIAAECAPNLVMIATAGEAQQVVHAAVCKALAAISEEAVAEAKRLKAATNAAEG
jgi:hypothetical protein